MEIIGETSMGRVMVDLQVANNQDVQMFKARAIGGDQVRQLQIKGLVDTGANYLILPTPVAEALGLNKVGEISVHYGDHSVQTRDMVDQVELELLGRKGTFRAIVEPNRPTALIGAIVLEDLDFIVDCGNQRIYPRDPQRIIAEVGFRDLDGS